MKLIIIAFALIATVSTACQQGPETIPGKHPNISYYGRTDFSDSLHPKQWAAGAYFSVGFVGKYCIINISDENYSNRRSNLLEVVLNQYSQSQLVVTKDSVTNIVIGNPPDELMKTLKGNVVRCFENYFDTTSIDDSHYVLVCRNTETAMGYTQVNSVTANHTLPCNLGPFYAFEFIGNSITCGAEADTTLKPSKDYQWGDWHRAYYSYGPLTARNFKASWSHVSVSGIGLIHSCCDMDVTMPQVYDKFVLRYNQKQYDFLHAPTHIFICLGQNDGIQDSTTFCNAYVDFVKQIKEVYRDEHIFNYFLLTSPMADDTLSQWQKQMLTSIEQRLKDEGFDNVCKYFFSRSWNSGGVSHPSIEDHKHIADELTKFINNFFKNM